MAQTDVSVTEFKGNAKNLISEIKKIETASKNLDASLVTVLSHLEEIEKKAAAKNVTNIGKQSNFRGTVISKGQNVVVGANGTAISGKSPRSKAYQDAVQSYNEYQKQEIALKKEQINLEKTITYLKKQQANVVKQEADTRAKNAEAKSQTAKYRLSAEHLSYEAGLGIKHQNLAGWYAEKSAHPEKFLAGAQLHNVRYQTGKAIGAVGNTISSLGVGGKAIGGLLDTIGMLVKSPVAGTAAAVTNLCKGIIDLGKSAEQAYAEIESIKTQLGVVFSNQTQAENVFGQISEYAVHSPFGVQQTSELAVLLKQSGVYASDLMDTLRMLGDTASGNMEKMKRIANNYAQIVSIGKASMLDMRQFAYAGIPIFEAVSKELNVSQQQLRKLISDGKVTSDIIEKVFKDLTGINGIFENATEKGAKTLKARLQNLADARQLALSSIGEMGVNIGNTYGGDSVVNKMVTGVEGIWQHLKDFVNTKNIEKSVQVIENRNNRIEELKALAAYLKQNGSSKSELKEIQRQIKELENKIDIDKERSVLANSYENKVNNYEELAKAFEDSGIVSEMKELWEKLGYENTGYFKLSDYQTAAEMYGLTELADVISELQKSIQGLTKITEEERKAEREKLLLDAQQLAFDKASKRADSTDSLNSSFQELLSIYRESDEYKEKEEEKRQKTLNEAKEILKKIADNTSETGTFDVTKKDAKGKALSISDFYAYVQQGAFSPGRKLNIVPSTASDAQKQEDKNLLMSQISYLSKNIMSSYKSLGVSGYVSDAFGNSVIDKLNKMSPDAFFNSFSSYYEKMEKALASMSDNTKNLSTQQRKAINEQTDMFTQLLPLMLSVLEVETGGINADTSSDKGKAGQEFIPLWKRILAQATGLSAEGITGTTQTLSNYRDDMAVRSLASGVMTAAVKTMDVATAQKLAKASNVVAQLPGSPAQTIQIDWKATREAVREFALQISASTEVITAYKNALEDEYNTFASLVAAGYTTAESQDLKNQKYVSGEKYSRLIASAGSQLVNAFGEKLITEEGRAVRLESDGKFYEWLESGEKGQEVAVDNLIVTESLFEIIKQTLPQISKDMHEANITLLKNQALEKALNNVKATQLTTRMLDYSTPLQQQISTFLVNNPDYLTSAFDSALTVVKNRHHDRNVQLNGYDFLEGKSNADILATAFSSSNDDYTRAMRDLVDETLEMIRNEVGSFVVNGPNLKSSYANLSELGYANEKLANVSAKLEELILFNKNGRYTNELRPEDYEGWRGGRNWIQKALGYNTENYDKEDFFASAMRAGYTSENVDLSQWKGAALKDSDLVEYLSEADKRALSLELHFKNIRDTVEEMSTGLLNAMNDFSQSAFLAPFEQLGDTLVKDNDYAAELGVRMKQLGGELLNQMGTYMARAGFSLIAMGADTMNWGLIAGGLALAAAGGFASGLGNAIKEGEQQKDKTDKESQKLENLKNDLTKLLEQARTDALYYENNLRHQTALGLNREFSYKSVHDAVITPQGVVETDPKDFLIATKTPQQFMGGGQVMVQPIINNSVINNTSAKVRQEQQQNADGTIDIVTIIEEAVGDFIASPRSDEAFSARDYRMGGKQSIR